MKKVEIWWVGHDENENLTGERYFQPEIRHEYYDRLDVKFDSVSSFELEDVVIVIVGAYFLYEWEVKAFLDALITGHVNPYHCNLRDCQ